MILGISSYLWQRIEDDKTSPETDLQGMNKDILTLMNMQSGSYSFRLTVTDTASQTDSTTVTVIVNSGSSSIYPKE